MIDEHMATRDGRRPPFDTQCLPMGPTTVASSQAGWAPLFDEAETSPFQAALASIEGALTHADVVRLYGESLSGGTAGVALFFAFLSESKGDDKWRRFAAGYVRHAIAGCAPGRSPFGLYRGDVGIAWIAAHRLLRVIPHEVDPCLAIDSWLVRQLERQPWRQAHDLVEGLAGFGVYALERMELPIGRVLLELVIQRLADTCTPTREGITWWTAPDLLLSESRRATYPDGCYNLGLAHGLPGIIALLAQAVDKNVAAGRARVLLRHAVNWLLAKRNPDHIGCCFPSMLPTNVRSPIDRRSRVSWCHGDLGVSVALYQAAITLDEPVLADQALAIARHAATRPWQRTGVVDAGLCHGAAGNGHIFNRIYQATREQVFRDAARYWFRQALDFHRPGQALGSFQAWTADSPGHGRWLWRPGFLQGVSGVGLALLAAITPRLEPDWDRLLLVAIPPRPDRRA